MFKHGLARTHEYHCWNNMIQRCLNKNRSDYKRYGGRGIKVCKRWSKLENFLEDMGNRPEGRTLDRRDNDKDYKLSNCRWTTPRKQANNRRNNKIVLYKGKEMTLTQAVRKAGSIVKYVTANKRITKLGWNVKKAVEIQARYM